MAPPFIQIIITRKNRQMKYILVVAMSVVLLACQGATQNKTELKSTKDSVSYAIGMSIGRDVGRNLKAQSVDMNAAVLVAGMKDKIDSATTMLTDSQAQAVMIAFQQRMMAAAAEKNKKEGEAFLAENKTKDGVKTTPSGLQYKVIKMGNGPKPKADQTVTVHYKGTTIDGKEFDSSHRRGQPAEFMVGQVIPGWVEGIQMMPVGSTWQFFIPSNLAYGEQGYGQQVAPGSTLIFEVELLSVK